jgi:hypothetical protein
VPLTPDPLQTFLDATADLRPELGDRMELCLDLHAVPRWRLWMRRTQVQARARAQARRQGRRDAWRAWQDTVEAEHSLRYQLFDALEELGGKNRSRSQMSARRFALMGRPRNVDTAAAVGKLAGDPTLSRVQLLACTESKAAGRAQLRMQHIQAGLDISAGDIRWRQTGLRLGRWSWGANHWPLRKRFDQRWVSGALLPAKENWVRVEEIAGFLKPPTHHSRVPVLVADLPTYALGQGDRMPLGYYRGPDGVERLLAIMLEDLLFALQVGRAGYGKTERALIGALALAHGGHGLMFLDPHGDTWARAMPYLAHQPIMARTWHVNLTGGPGTRIGTWNPLGMDRGHREADKVVRAVVDGFSAVLGWADQTAPRALTILTKAVEALVHVNTLVCRAGHPELQATIFQIDRLLNNGPWRDTVVSVLPPGMAAWWRDTFPSYPNDAAPTVTNVITRLYADPTVRAFLGTPTGIYDIRHAMDEGLLVWVCPDTGPAGRLVSSLLVQDLFRAGLSRMDLPVNQRRPFYAFIDELTAVDGGAIAAIAEQLRKFGVRLLAMTQMAQRLQEGTRMAMVQNSSVLATTAGSLDAVRVITNEWHGDVDPNDAVRLPKYQHYLSFVVGGNRVGPLLIRGAEVGELYNRWHRPRRIKAYEQACDSHMNRAPVEDLLENLDGLDERIHRFLSRPLPSGPDDDPQPPRPPTSPRDELEERRQRRTEQTRTTYV